MSLGCEENRRQVHDYLDGRLRINSHKYPTSERSENGELNTAKWCIGLEMAGHDPSLASDFIRSNQAPVRALVLSPTHKSHDNLTGMVALAKATGWSDIKVNKDPEREYHPRSRLYWAWARERNLLTTCGLLFVCLANVFTCLRHYKIRNGEKIIKTDNEILMLLMYRGGLKDVWFCRFFGWICNELLVRRFGPNIYTGMMELWYTHDSHHPVKVVWRNIDRGFKWWK